MKKIFLLLFLMLIGCSKEEENPADYFQCTVDYVEFIDASNVIVKFETTLGNQTNYYFGRYTYVKETNNYYIGDDLVTISNFSQKGNTATFVFEYGDNLGFFCATIFEALPEHIHYTFDAEAETTSSAKVVGRWKIRRRSNPR